jgi:hypothetical protein
VFIEHGKAFGNDLYILGWKGKHDKRVDLLYPFILASLRSIYRKNAQKYGLTCLLMSHHLKGQYIAMILCKTYIVTGGEVAIPHH